MEVGENHEPPRFYKSNVPRGEHKLAVLWLHHVATLQSADETTVDLLCKTMFHYFYEIQSGGWSSPSSTEEPPLDDSWHGT